MVFDVLSDILSLYTAIFIYIPVWDYYRWDTSVWIDNRGGPGVRSQSAEGIRLVTVTKLCNYFHYHIYGKYLLFSPRWMFLVNCFNQLFGIWEARFESLRRPFFKAHKHADSIIHKREVYRHQEHVNCHAHFSLTWMRKRERLRWTYKDNGEFLTNFKYWWILVV